jgi:hypothetical protein
MYGWDNLYVVFVTFCLPATVCGFICRTELPQLLETYTHGAAGGAGSSQPQPAATVDPSAQQQQAGSSELKSFLESQVMAALASDTGGMAQMTDKGRFWPQQTSKNIDGNLALTRKKL